MVEERVSKKHLIHYCFPFPVSLYNLFSNKGTMFSVPHKGIRNMSKLRIEQDGFQVLQIKTTVCFLMRVIGLNSLLFIHPWPTKGHLLNTPSDTGCVSRYLFIFPACQTAFCLCHRLFCLWTISSNWASKLINKLSACRWLFLNFFCNLFHTADFFTVATFVCS